MGKGKDVIGIVPGVSSIKLELTPDGVLAAYFRMSDKPVFRTTESEIDDVMIDLDRDGEIIGVELINPQTRPLNGILKKLSKSSKGASVKRFQVENSDRIKKIQELLVS